MLVDGLDEQPVLDLSHVLLAEYAFYGFEAVLGAIHHLVRHLVSEGFEFIDGGQVFGQEDFAEFGVDEFQRLNRAVVALADLFDLIEEQADDVLAGVGVAEHLLALAVDNVAMLVNDVVELDESLPDIEVVAFDLGLGLLDGASDHARFEWHVLGHAQFLHHPGHPFGREALHDVVAERDEEAAAAGVALAAGTTAKLVVDAA